MSLKPMKASDAVLDELVYPVLASPKLDGIRAVVDNRRLLSNQLKLIPNKRLQDLLARPGLDGFDGELICGEPWAADVYRKTVSAVMGADNPSDQVRYYVFDLWDRGSIPYDRRWHELQRLADKLSDAMPVDVIEQVVLEDRSQLDLYEAAVIAKGFEGVMLRRPNAPYKFGRSTAKEGYLLKVKRFVDAEAEVIGVEEEMFNGNEAQTNELGHTKRSTAKAGLIGKGTMGALVCRGINGGFEGVEFRIGTGFTAEDRAREWPVGTIVKYKHFPVGTKDKPRHPGFLGIRSRIDL